MSSGTLPGATYHRASHLGAGSFGSVVVVYNDDGEEFALKLFLNEDEDDNDNTNSNKNTNQGSDDDDEDDDDSEYSASQQQPIALGALREISCLRLLRGTNAHPNIVELVDVQADWTSSSEPYESGGGGAGTGGCLSMALPLGKHGSVAAALNKHMFLKCPLVVKVKLAYGLLSAVVFLHDNGILHRDIKSDNILLALDEQNEDTNGDDTSGVGASWKPILIDFSLAKPVDEIMWNSSSSNNISSSCSSNSNSYATPKARQALLENMLHTGDVGTMIYTAPEVVAQEGYGKPADLYSVGIVLLELVQSKLFTAEKPKQANAQIAAAVAALPTTTLLADLVRSLLHPDSDQRISARDACHHPVFVKFGLCGPPSRPRPPDVTAAATTTNSSCQTIHTTESSHLPVESPPRRIVHMATSLPYEPSTCVNGVDENESPLHASNCKTNIPPQSKSLAVPTGDDKKYRQKMERRLKMIDKLLHDLDSDHPWTRWAALEYSIQLEQLESGMEDNGNQPSQSLADCCVLAHRFWELDLIDLQDLDERTTGPFSHWNLDEYIDTEATIFMLLDYCLYPRTLGLS